MIRAVGGPGESTASAPGRRTVLRVAAGVALTGVAVLSGCTGSGSDAGSTSATDGSGPSPDELARRRAVRHAQDLSRDATLLSAASPPLRAVLGAVAADTRSELAALGAGPSSTSATGATTSDSPSPPPTPASLVAALRAAAHEAGTDCLVTSPGMAVLLARLAAAWAAHADLLASAARLPAPGPLLLGGTSTPTTTRPGIAPPPSPSTSASRPATPGTATAQATSSPAPSPSRSTLDDATRAALMRMLQGEHAAVYAYGVVTARVVPALRARAEAGWSAHLALRDALEQELLLTGVTPPAAAAGYDLGALAPGSPGAVALAARVEAAVAAVAAQAVASTASSHRSDAAGTLVGAARRRAGWTGRSQALPG